MHVVFWIVVGSISELPFTWWIEDDSMFSYELQIDGLAKSSG